MNRDEIYRAALLHDVGKFVERAKAYDNTDVKKDYSEGRYSHANYTGFYLSTLKKAADQYPALTHLITNEVIEGAYRHHQPKTFFQKIIQLADWLSSSERELKESDEKIQKEYEKYNEIPLKSIFSQEKTDFFYPLKPLKPDHEVIFPKSNQKVNAREYQALLEQFNPDMGQAASDAQIYAILQRYWWCVPSATVGHEPVISLFDHSKTTAALALCLFDEYEAGALKEEELKDLLEKYLKAAGAFYDAKVKAEKESKTVSLAEILKTLPQPPKFQNPHFLLIRGDLSGIQNFIFNVSSQKASKSLKGRSAYLALLSEMAARFFMDRLELKEANLLYTGGGNFNLLAPYSKKAAFEEAKKEFLEKILEKHGGDLYFALGCGELSCYDFIDFGANWIKVSDSVNSFKARKWSELDLSKNYEKLFRVSEALEENRVCVLCKGHEEVKPRKLKLSKGAEDEEEPVSLCLPCVSYIELGEELRNASFMAIKKMTPNPRSSGWFDFLGYQMEFADAKQTHPLAKNGFNLIKINDSHLFDTRHLPCQSFCFLPVAMPYDENQKRIKTFEELAAEAKGDRKLGILKLDVDNLGSLFASQTRSISRLTQLSRMLSLFFEGYLSKLIQESEEYEKALYVVFSGGDDSFILGAYDVLLTFADELRGDFEKYTAQNPAFSFSAGFAFARAKERVQKFGQWAEEALDHAKTMTYPKETEPVKDKITLFDEAFGWKELKYLTETSGKITRLIDHQDKKKKESRALIHKLQKSCRGFESILEEKRKKRFQPMQLKIWRLSYYLRNMLPENSKEKEELITLYEKIVFDKDPKVQNPMLLPAAIRLAELKTKKTEEKNRKEEK